jgi:hypothetical protein
MSQELRTTTVFSTLRVSQTTVDAKLWRTVPVLDVNTAEKNYMTYQPTYMITAKISDFTESIYVNFAREHGTALMGMTAEEFKEFKENESEEKV